MLAPRETGTCEVGLGKGSVKRKEVGPSAGQPNVMEYLWVRGTRIKTEGAGGAYRAVERQGQISLSLLLCPALVLLCLNKRRKRFKGKVMWIWIVPGNALHSFTHRFVLHILSLHWNPRQGLSYICNPTQLCTIWVRNDLEDWRVLSSWADTLLQPICEISVSPSLWPTLPHLTHISFNHVLHDNPLSVQQYFF